MVCKVFIIGEIPDRISISCIKKFKKAQLFLEKKELIVINPIDIICKNKNKSEIYINIKKIRALLNCNAVCILPCITIKNNPNAELVLALKLDMLLIQYDFFLNDNECDILVENKFDGIESLNNY